MTTRCGIAIKMDSLVYAVYCHYDGYPDHVGSILVENYPSRDIVLKLVALGDLNDLGKDLGRCSFRQADFLGPRIYHNLREYEESMKKMQVDFVYIIDRKGVWWYKDTRDSEYTHLAEFLRADEDA